MHSLDTPIDIDIKVYISVDTPVLWELQSMLAGKSKISSRQVVGSSSLEQKCELSVLQTIKKVILVV